MQTTEQKGSGIKNERVLAFVVFCIENIAAALNRPAERVYHALAEDSDILEQYVIPSYDVLHTQGREYIVNDICEVMKLRGVEVQ